MAAAGFWDNHESAQQTVSELKSLHAIVKPLEETISGVDDLTAMVEMAEEDASFAAEIPNEERRSGN